MQSLETKSSRPRSFETETPKNGSRDSITANYGQTITGQKFRRGQKLGLTLDPGRMEKRRIHPEWTPALQIHGHLCNGLDSKDEHGLGLLQLLRRRCIECVVHHKRDVREEQQYLYVARTSNNTSKLATQTIPDASERT